MDTQFNNLQPNEIDPTKAYRCSPKTESKGFTLLMRKVLEGHRLYILDEINSIINDDPTTLDKQNEQGWTALIIACRNSNTYSNSEIVKLLINRGCNLNLLNNSGWSALIFASRYANENSTIKTVKLLIKAGANLNLQGTRGWSALMIASRYANERSNIKTVKLLLKAGANLDLQNNSGWSALMLTTLCLNKKGNVQVTKLLTTSLCDLMLKNSSGEYAHTITENSVSEYLSLIIARNKLMMSSLKNVCSAYITKNKKYFLEYGLKQFVNGDVMDLLKQFGMFKEISN